MSVRTTIARSLQASRHSTRTISSFSRPSPSFLIQPRTISVILPSRWKSDNAPSSWTDRLFGSSKPRYGPGEFAKDPIISFDELLPITEQPSDDVLLIDVREPDEIQQGMIPSAVSLPLSQMREAFDPKAPEGDFYKRFSFRKPLASQNLVFYCRSGKRSAAAAELVGERGYKSVRNYRGSWLDWSRRSKGKEEEDDYNDDGTARG